MPTAGKRIGFIGAGQMAEALARGFVSKGVAVAADIWATDPVAERRDVFAAMGAHAAATNAEVVENADVIFIAVKPQYVGACLREAAPLLRPDAVVVSIAAGVTLAALGAAAGPAARLVRVMPNTPCLVGETAAAMCLGGRADEGDAETVRALFAAVGSIYRVEEKLLSAVTGLSGSGPAYVFLAIEAMADGGVRAVSLAASSTEAGGAPNISAQHAQPAMRLASQPMRRNQTNHPPTAANRPPSDRRASRATLRRRSPRRRCSARRRWCWRPGASRARSRTWSARPRARRSRACTSSSARACARPS
jgi:pyrroline-5-carboxylate reductase